MAGDTPHDFDADRKVSAGASGEVVRIFSASVIVVLLLTGGVYWLHHIPASSPARDAGVSVQVRLLPAEDPTPLPLMATPQPDAAATAGQSALSKESHEDTPDDTALPSPVPAVRPAPSSSTPRIRQPAASAETSKLSLEFQRSLFRHIARFQRYPARARDRQLRGTVQVVFLLRRDGSVVDAWVTSTSGESVLDREALETIRRAEPLPPIPGELPDHLSILLPVAFALP